MKMTKLKHLLLPCVVGVIIGSAATYVEMIGWPYIKRGRTIFEICPAKVSEASWSKSKYDENGFLTDYRNSDGEWKKFERDPSGREVFFADSFGFWRRYSIDKARNLVLYENSNGYWEIYDDKSKKQARIINKGYRDGKR